MIVLLVLLLPLAALAQEAAPLLDPSALPALLPAWLERLLSYATLGGAGLVALANLAGSALNRWRAAGRTVHPAVELVVGLALDLGTDLGALRARLLGAPPTANGSQTPPAA